MEKSPAGTLPVVSSSAHTGKGLAVTMAADFASVAAKLSRDTVTATLIQDETCALLL